MLYLRSSKFSCIFILPEPFGRNIFELDDIWSYDKEEALRLKEKYSEQEKVDHKDHYGEDHKSKFIDELLKLRKKDQKENGQ